MTHPRWVTLCHLKQVTHLAGFRTAAVGHFRVGHLWVTCLAILSGSLACTATDLRAYDLLLCPGPYPFPSALCVTLGSLLVPFGIMFVVCWGVLGCVCDLGAQSRSQTSQEGSFWGSEFATILLLGQSVGAKAGALGTWLRNVARERGPWLWNVALFKRVWFFFRTS